MEENLALLRRDHDTDRIGLLATDAAEFGQGARGDDHFDRFVDTIVELRGSHG